MKRPFRTRLSVEMLEARDCPSVTAVVEAGSLKVAANAATSGLTITQSSTTPGTFTVAESSIPGGSVTLTGVTEDILLRLSNANDTGVVIDLGGQSNIDD